MTSKPYSKTCMWIEPKWTRDCNLKARVRNFRWTVARDKFKLDSTLLDFYLFCHTGFCFASLFFSLDRLYVLNVSIHFTIIISYYLLLLGLICCLSKALCAFIFVGFFKVLIVFILQHYLCFVLFCMCIPIELCVFVLRPIKGWTLQMWWHWCILCSCSLKNKH